MSEVRVNQVSHPTSQVGKVGLPPLDAQQSRLDLYTPYPNEERGKLTLRYENSFSLTRSKQH
jgi:hypothetical protein